MCPKRLPKGAYFRTSDSRWIRRWKCRSCLKTYSGATFSPCFSQNKRRLNKIIRDLLASGVSQRRIAIVLNINRKTVARKLCFLAKQARLSQKDERTKGWNDLFAQLQESVSPEAVFTSDSPVSYPFLVRKHFPKATHLQVKGQRGSSTGQGELKKII